MWARWSRGDQPPSGAGRGEVGVGQRRDHGFERGAIAADVVEEFGLRHGSV